MDDTTLLSYDVNDLYNIGGLLGKPKEEELTPEDITSDYIVENEEPVVDETSVPEWEINELTDNPEEEKIVEEAVEKPTPERLTKLDYTVDNPEEEKTVQDLKLNLGQRVMDSANEKVGTSLWDTIIKGV